MLNPPGNSDIMITKNAKTQLTFFAQYLEDIALPYWENVDCGRDQPSNKRRNFFFKTPNIFPFSFFYWQPELNPHNLKDAIVSTIHFSMGSFFFFNVFNKESLTVHLYICFCPLEVNFQGQIGETASLNAGLIFAEQYQVLRHMLVIHLDCLHGKHN